MLRIVLFAILAAATVSLAWTVAAQPQDDTMVCLNEAEEAAPARWRGPLAHAVENPGFRVAPAEQRKPKAGVQDPGRWKPLSPPSAETIRAQAAYLVALERLYRRYQNDEHKAAGEAAKLKARYFPNR